MYSQNKRKNFLEISSDKYKIIQIKYNFHTLSFFLSVFSSFTDIYDSQAKRGSDCSILIPFCQFYLLKKLNSLQFWNWDDYLVLSIAMQVITRLPLYDTFPGISICLTIVSLRITTSPLFYFHPFLIKPPFFSEHYQSSTTHHKTTPPLLIKYFLVTHSLQTIFFNGTFFFSFNLKLKEK